MKKHAKVSTSVLTALLVGLFLGAFALSHASTNKDEKPLDAYGTARTLKKDDLALLSAKKPKLTNAALQLDLEVKNSFKEKKPVELNMRCSAVPMHGAADPLAIQMANVTAKKGNNKFRFTYALLEEEHRKFLAVQEEGGDIDCYAYFGKGTIDAVTANNELNISLEWKDGKLKVKK